eukprot:EST45244.1 Hypothetical protein SS50377_14820 [Spironucleus salmonicida]
MTILFSWIFIQDDEDIDYINVVDNPSVIILITNQINLEIILTDISQLSSLINEENVSNRLNYSLQSNNNAVKKLYFSYNSFQENIIQFDNKRSKDYLIQTRPAEIAAKEKQQKCSFLFINAFNQYFDSFIFDYLTIIDTYLDRMQSVVSQLQQQSLINIIDLFMKLFETKLISPTVNDMISSILKKISNILFQICIFEWFQQKQFDFKINSMLLQKIINASFLLLKYFNQCPNFADIFIKLLLIQKAQNKQIDNYEVENQIYTFTVKNYNNQKINYFANQIQLLILQSQNLQDLIQSQLKFSESYLQRQNIVVQSLLVPEKIDRIIVDVQSVLTHSIQLIQSESKLQCLNKSHIISAQQILLNSLNFFPGFVKMHYETLQTIIGLTPENFSDDDQFLTISQVRNFDQPVSHIKSLQAAYLHIYTAFYLASVIKNTNEIALSTYFQQKQYNKQIGSYIQQYIYNILLVKVKHIMPYIQPFQLPSNIQSFYTTRDIIKHLQEAEQIFLLNFQNQNVFIIQSMFKQLELIGDKKDKVQRYFFIQNQIQDFEQFAQFSTNLRFGRIDGELSVYLALQKTKTQEIFDVLLNFDESLSLNNLDSIQTSFPVASMKQLILIEQEIDQLQNHQLSKQLLQELIKLQIDAATQRYFNDYCYSKEQLLLLESDPLINYSNSFFTFQIIQNQMYLVLLICDHPLPSYVQSQPVSIKAYFKASPMLYGLIQLMYINHYNKVDHVQNLLQFLQKKIINLDQAMDFKLASQFQLQQIDDVQIDAEFFDIDQTDDITSKLISPTFKELKQLEIAPSLKQSLPNLSHKKSSLRLQLELSLESSQSPDPTILPGLKKPFNILIDDMQQSDDQVLSINSAQQMLIMSPQMPKTARCYLNQDSPHYSSKKAIEERKFFTIIQENGSVQLKNQFSIESSLEIYNELFICILQKIKSNEKFQKKVDIQLINQMIEQLQIDNRVVVDNSGLKFGE